jgi:acylphosphatase
LTEKENKRAHLYISGRVQGVNFRYYTRQQARSLGVKGWVRNLIDGRVEAVFEGDAVAVERMVDWCHHGPRGAWVDTVEVQWEDPTEEFSGFEILLSYG